MHDFASMTKFAHTFMSICYGACVRGLESFSQLVLFDFNSESYGIVAAPWVIHDAPRFPHRGLMVDTSRHFLPVSALREIVHSLPYSKINVLHWHMSDYQSFPMQSKTYPKLWDAAYSAQEKYTQVKVLGGSLCVWCGFLPSCSPLRCTGD